MDDCNNVNFTLSETAKRHIVGALSTANQLSAGGLVTCLTFSGAYAPARDGQILWNYRGPNFLIAAQKSENLRPGAYCDLLGVRVWIGETEQILLDGKTLTIKQYGSPEPAELLVIENAPDDYFDAMMREGKL